MDDIIQLEDWCVVPVRPYAAPEEGARLNGIAHNHPKFDDGDRITTSVVMDYDGETGVFTVASGKRYRLGEVSPDYEREFPDAAERVRLNASKMRDVSPS